MPCCRHNLNWRSNSGLDVVSMPPSPVVITLRGWKEKQAICPRGPSNWLPLSIEPDLASRRASGIFDQRNVMTACHSKGQAGRKACPFGG